MNFKSISQFYFNSRLTAHDKKNFVTSAIFEYAIVYTRASLAVAIMIAIFVYKVTNKIKK